MRSAKVRVGHQGRRGGPRDRSRQACRAVWLAIDIYVTVTARAPSRSSKNAGSAGRPDPLLLHGAVQNRTCSSRPRPRARSHCVVDPISPLRKVSHMGSSALQSATKSIIEWGSPLPRTSPGRSRRPPRSSARSRSMTTCSGSGCPRTSTRRCAGRSRRARRSTRRRPTSSPSAMKDWAIEHGATHYTHWFQPLTGITAEKHDAFITPTSRRQRGGRVQRQGTHQGRAGRVELPVGRHALHLRGARLHGVGSDERALAARHAERHDARHSDRLRELDG